MIKPLVRL